MRFPAHVLFLAVLILFSSFDSSSAEIILVPDDHETIQGAIDAAEDGDVVLVSEGTYIENITFDGKAVTVESESGPEETILDASDLTIDELTGCGVLFTSGEGSDSVFRGFTLINGTGYDGRGGGIYCDNADPVIEDCIFLDGDVENGGGIYLELAHATITNCEFRDNTASGIGGGIGGCQSHPTITDCVIEDNYAGVLGAGIGVHIHQEHITIEGCVIANNELGDSDERAGAAIWLLHGTATITNTIVRGNSGDAHLVHLWENGTVDIDDCQFVDNTSTGAALFIDTSGDLELNRVLISGNGGDGIHVLSEDSTVIIENSTIADNDGTAVLETCTNGDLICTSDLTIDNSILWGNEEQIDFEVSDAEVNYSCIEGGFDGEGNIEDDPEFGAAYALSSGSPCVDAGDPDLTDTDGSVLDMGCHPFLGFDFLRGDADGNGDVFAILDALYILEYGFTNGTAPPCRDAGDVDDNGVVFAILEAVYLLEWGFTNGTEPPAPGPDTCGPDETDDDLDCATDTCT